VQNRARRFDDAASSRGQQGNRSRVEHPAESPEAEILRDEDNLDAIDAVGIAQNFAFTGVYGNPLWDPEGEEPSGIDYCYDKLLKLKNEMHTDAARELAAERHEFLAEFVTGSNASGAARPDRFGAYLLQSSFRGPLLDSIETALHSRLHFRWVAKTYIHLGVGTLTLGVVGHRMVTTRLGRTPDGRRFEVADEIDAPAERLWELLTDTERWPEWGPWVEDVESDDRWIRTGTTGTVETAVGVRVPFEVTSCVNFRWTWEIAGVPATGHRVEPLNGHSRVVFEVPLFGAGSSPLCGIALRNLAEVA
jgi:uncharacterized protein YndB with AHSA1/START domain